MNPFNNDSGFLKTKSSRILTAVLVCQAGLLYGFSRAEHKPVIAPLAQFTTELGSWVRTKEGVVDKETQDVLKADDVLSRTYGNRETFHSAHLFVAFFRSQRTGQAPHSPKNCLPGSGWVPSVSDEITVDIPGRGAIPMNRYVVAKGDAKSVVLYWYQSRNRVVASEYTAKIYVVADAMRYNRTDTSLVRVTVPIQGGITEDEAVKTAVDFAKTVFPVLSAHLPN